MLRTIVPLCLLLAACQRDPVDDPVDDTAEPTDDPSEPEDTAEPDLVDVLGADPRFSTLVGLLESEGLDETLRGKGPFTVFAPTDDALATVDLDPDGVADLLAYHVADGTLAAASLPSRIPSLATFTLFVDTSDGVVVNGVATVEEADLQATNGLVHAIDALLEPPDISRVLALAGLSTLPQQVGKADPSIGKLLAGDGPITLFAPTDKAFETPPPLVDFLPIEDVLTYHVVAERLAVAELPTVTASSLSNGFDNPISLVATGGEVNGIPIEDGDLVATNGTVHVVGTVLTPPDIVDHASFLGLSSLVANLDASGLTTTMRGAGPFTLFGPTDQAFVDGSKFIGTLTPDQVRNVLLYHVADTSSFPQPIVAGSLTQDQSIPTLQGESIPVDLTSGTQVGGANVERADVHGSNGVLHAVDAVLIPPSKL